jgi:hypothetical protein
MTELELERKKTVWVSQIETLVDAISAWATERQWLVDKHQKTLNEEPLGTYSASELIIKTPQGSVIIEPVGKNIMGADGRVDISAFPSFNRMLLIQKKGNWQVKTDSRIDWPKPWGKDTFYDIVKALTAE